MLKEKICKKLDSGVNIHTADSDSSFGAALFNFTTAAPATGVKGGNFRLANILLVTGTLFCLSLFFPVSSLASCDKLEAEMYVEAFEGTDNLLTVSAVIPAGGGFRLSVAPFSVFFTFILVLVELPSNTISGRFRKPSTVVTLKIQVLKFSEIQTRSSRVQLITQDICNVNRQFKKLI